MLLPLALLIMISCDEIEKVQLIKKAKINGFAQKGPFITGSSVSIAELDTAFNQTGRVYSTTTDGNSGLFELKQIELVSPYVLLKADGYYFNEITGQISQSPLTLFTLADVGDVNSVNINVLTHLERGRVEYLINNQGLTFAAAKKQAQSEVLQIFNLSIQNDSVSESIEIHGNDDNDAVLLAVSCILQGTLTTAEMTELMAKIIADIKTDGTLNDQSLGSALIDNARLINPSVIRSNLVNKYAENDSLNLAVPDFEQYITAFIQKTSFVPVKVITYPAVGAFGSNILHDTVNVVDISKSYSLKADLPTGNALKVVIKNGLWHFVVIPAPVNWTFTSYNQVSQSQIFTVGEAAKPNDLDIRFATKGKVQIEYFENNALVPTRVKELTVRDPNEVPVNQKVYSYPYWSDDIKYYNILSDSLRTTHAGKVYAMRAHIPAGKSLKVVMKAASKGWVEEADGKNQGWTVSPFDQVSKSQTFTTDKQLADMGIVITGAGPVTIELYENNSVSPTKIKTLN